ncbi:hypothetical protein BOO69_14885 [Sulfitobacter alexandrii]|uniref:Tat pathway signal sequence domain protein n=1 Tax=Sulfitobacter alexandrii TaxID=1917485 RepID=A0A1J0WJP9_9RHOB|nr:hypothetical protein [Sulfitobacter alexandrii]APE44553.1 hypothetical protein BOO69_14885 [Sulfitobacter alexandrii]
MRLVGKGACALCVWMAGIASAQEEDLEGRIAVELNAVQTVEQACTLTFLITNGLGAAIDKAVYETVLFDTTGQVNRLTLFDFGTLPPARPRVRQFAVPDMACDRLGRILFNGAQTCDGSDLAEGVCGTALVPSSRTEIEVIG